MNISFPILPMLRCSYADSRLSLKGLAECAAVTMAEMLSFNRRALVANDGSRRATSSLSRAAAPGPSMRSRPARYSGILLHSATVEAVIST